MTPRLDSNVILIENNGSPLGTRMKTPNPQPTPKGRRIFHTHPTSPHQRGGEYSKEHTLCGGPGGGQASGCSGLVSGAVPKNEPLLRRNLGPGGCSLHMGAQRENKPLFMLKKEKKERKKRDFPDSPEVEIPRFHCRRHGFDPWSGN